MAFYEDSYKFPEGSPERQYRRDRSAAYENLYEKINQKVNDTNYYSTLASLGLGAAGTAGAIGSMAYAANKNDKEKTAFEIPFGLLTFLSNNIGEKQLNHGISEGIRGISNVYRANFKPSTKPLHPIVVRAKNFLDEHANTINHVADSDKWRAGAMLAADADLVIGGAKALEAISNSQILP